MSGSIPSTGDNLQSRVQHGLILIPDISGYSEFIKQTDIALGEYIGGTANVRTNQRPTVQVVCTVAHQAWHESGRRPLRQCICRVVLEPPEDGCFLSVDDARTEVFEYIECYYNRVRKHSSLVYKSPEQVENEYYKNLQV